MKKVTLFPFLLIISNLCLATGTIAIAVNKTINQPVSLVLFQLGNDKEVTTKVNFDENNLAVLNFEIEQDFLFAYIVLEGDKYIDILIEPNQNYFIKATFTDSFYPEIIFDGFSKELNQQSQIEKNYFQNFYYEGKTYFDWPSEYILNAYDALRLALNNQRKNNLDKKIRNSIRGKMLEQHLDSNLDMLFLNYGLGFYDNFLENPKQLSKYRDEIDKIISNESLLPYSSNNYQYMLRMFSMALSNIYSRDFTNVPNDFYIQFLQILPTKYHLTNSQFEFIHADIIQTNGRFLELEVQVKLLTDFIEKYPDSKYLDILNRINGDAEYLRNNPIAKPFEMVSLSGEKTNLTDLKGSWLYFDIWATWCGPCLAEFKHVQNLKKGLVGNDSLKFVYLSIDSDIQKWKTFVDRHSELEGLHFNMTGDELKTFFKEYQLGGVPHYLLISPKGILVEHNATRPSNEDTIELLNGLME